MYFKSYDGWQKIVGDDNKKAVLAQFTKSTGETVHYNAAALRRKADKPSENMDSADTALLKKASSEGPLFFRSFDGWKNYGRGKKTIMIAHFVTAAGVGIDRGLSALQNMTANPPKKFSAFDAILLKTAIEDGPKQARR